MGALFVIGALYRMQEGRSQTRVQLVIAPALV